ncbi:MAG: hypothetical protein ACLFM8_00905 [Halobacteriales archaeon]
MADRRQVPVPLAMYKLVTVVTTGAAVLAVVGGLYLIDQGTDRARAAPSEVDPVVTAAGVGLIVLAAATYAFSTRFTPGERGNDKGPTTEPADDG